MRRCTARALTLPGASDNTGVALCVTSRVRLRSWFKDSRQVRRASIVLAYILTLCVTPAWPILSMAAVHQSVELKVEPGHLSGTLTLPDDLAQKACPVVLLIAGSGPTDRDGNSRLESHHLDNYRQLAEALAARGIASLRYDKRGVGESHLALTSEDQLRFGDFVGDALGWAHLLRDDPRFSSVIVMGHSEGALIGMMAAGRLPSDAFISLEGAGEPITRVLERQLRPRLPPDLYAQAQAIIVSLEAGRTVENVSPKLAGLFRPSVQAYDISWFSLDPKTEIRKLSMPVLIVQGREDAQVAVSDAEQLKDAYPDAKLMLLPHMEHQLIDSDLRPANGAVVERKPIDAEMISGIVAFIDELPPKKEGR